MTLKQACSSEYQGAQGAFKDSMIHWILQFTLLIAFRCVLHRWENQEIRCQKLYFSFYLRSYNDIQLHRLMCKGVNDHRIAYYGRSAIINGAQVCGYVRGLGLTEWDPVLFTNDPSAGSPTDTLLWLLLPLNDQVCTSFQHSGAVAGSQTSIPRAH